MAQVQNSNEQCWFSGIAGKATSWDSSINCVLVHVPVATFLIQLLNNNWGKAAEDDPRDWAPLHTWTPGKSSWLWLWPDPGPSY